MSEYNSKCGPDATDNYDRYTHWGNGNYSRSHVINGTGTVTKCYVDNYSNYTDSYTISDGITELADGCFNKAAIGSVNLPQTLLVIGDNCFAASKISYLNPLDKKMFLILMKRINKSLICFSKKIRLL